MDLVATDPATDPAPDHTSLSHPDASIPGTTSASTAQKHLSQAMNGADNLSSDNTPSSIVERPLTLAKIDGSPYQLVFGIEDTGSETSLTGDSPLVYDSSGRVLPGFSQSQRSSSDGAEAQSRESDPSPPQPSDASPCLPSDGSHQPSDASPHPPLDASPPKPSDASLSPPDASAGSLDVSPQEIASSAVASISDAVNYADSAPTHGDTADTGPKDCTNDNGNHTTATNSQSSCNKDTEEGPKDGLPSPEEGPVESPELHSPGSTLKVADSDVGKKAHPLSFLTSDSEVGETPTPPPEPYSPIPNTSGEGEARGSGGRGGLQL